MATQAQVERILADLTSRLGRLDASTRALLPSRRTIEVCCPDLGLVYHAVWHDGRLGELQTGPAARAHIRAVVSSEDLVALSSGALAVRKAWSSDRIRVHASVTDLLRLRAAL